MISIPHARLSVNHSQKKGGSEFMGMFVVPNLLDDSLSLSGSICLRV